MVTVVVVEKEYRMCGVVTVINRPRPRSLNAATTNPLPASVNLHRHPLGHLINHPRRVPIRQTDTTVTTGSADCIRAIGTVDSDSAFAPPDPGNPDRVTRSWGNVIKVFASLAMIQHRFVPAE